MRALKLAGLIRSGVSLVANLRPQVRTRSSKESQGKLIDQVRVYVRGGAGGQGSPHLGGIGGDGGDVIARAEAASLAHLARNSARRFVAGNGANSTSQRPCGEKGRDLVLRVPAGTAVVNDDGEQVADLDHVGTCMVLVKGGRGGSQLSTGYNGERGETKVLRLELKLIADVGLVGFPNAGKSTLLRCLSNATPKVASYPLMTHDGHEVIMADLPGLVEGAHRNVGMGHRFLKHVERTKALLFVVDVQGFQLSHEHEYRDAFETVQLLTAELELYKDDLVKRPCVLVVTKMDAPGSLDKLKELINRLNQTGKGAVPSFYDVVPIAALYCAAIEPLKSCIVQLLTGLASSTQ